MYSKKVYADALLIVVVVVGLPTTACSRYGVTHNTRHDMHIHYENIYQAEPHQAEPPDKPSFLKVDENSMTPFCKAIAQCRYKELKDLLNEIASPNPKIFDDVIYLITGYEVNKKDHKQYPKRALLAQVITAYEDELFEDSYTKELLDRLFEILARYGFDLHKAFLQKHGADQNTIIHLAVDTANVAIVKCLVDWYLKQDGGHGHDDLIKVCSVPNGLGATPLARVAEAMYDHPLMCSSQHGYDEGCESCDHEIEMRIGRNAIVLYLLELGVPVESLLHCVIRHDPGALLIEIMEVIQKRKINRYTPKDLVSLKDTQGDSLLFRAVKCCDYELAEYLLALGACPMQFNYKGICPAFLAVGFRDMQMVACLSKAECILERICNMNAQNEHGLTALEVAKSPDGCGISRRLQKYCNRFKQKYGRPIVHNGWDWKANDKIEQLLSHLCNYFATKSTQPPNLYFHSMLGRNIRSPKRNHTDADARYGSSIGPSKRRKVALDTESTNFLFSAPSLVGVASLSSFGQAIGGG